MDITQVILMLLVFVLGTQVQAKFVSDPLRGAVDSYKHALDEMITLTRKLKAQNDALKQGGTRADHPFLVTGITRGDSPLIPPKE